MKKSPTPAPAPRASCPGNLMLAGEYAVVDGGPAVMLAVNAQAFATVREEEQELSPFLWQVQTCLADAFGSTSVQALAAKRVQVNTSAFHYQGAKLGLGSSAAATVAAIGACLGQVDEPLDIDNLHRLASKAHGNAQAAMGARGSGADIAACTLGGALRFQIGAEESQVSRVTLPSGLHLVFPWTGVAAQTAPLVARVQEYRGRQSEDYQRLASGISACAEALAKARDPSDAVEAIAAGAEALRSLADAVGIELWLKEHSQLESLAQRFGGALKPTGAGAGDLALAAFSESDAAQSFQKSLVELGILCPPLLVEPQGVRLLA